jgi:nucleotide-binding universal stress UspA family protein
MNDAIIIGVDGSADSSAALEVAAGLASRLGMRLVVAHVAEPAFVPYAASVPFGGIAGAGRHALADEVEAQQEAAEALLEHVVDAAGLPDADRRVVVGTPADALADLADEEHADLIVVGSRGRGAFKSAFLGSVSNSLLGVARRPVLIVPRGAQTS